MIPIFITGIGTDVGKTIVSAILVEALGAAYWKPVQAGNVPETDSSRIRELVPQAQILSEVYLLSQPASPHIAARKDNISINTSVIISRFNELKNSIQSPYLIIEGAGGLMVPLNEEKFVIDLIEDIGASVILISRNYLGSISHSLMTAAVCRSRGLDVLGWIFTDQFMDYEKEIVHWSGYPSIASIPFSDKIDREFIQLMASKINKSWIP